MYYRRALIPGATYFFTLTLENRNSDQLTRHHEALKFAFKHVQRNHPFQIDAIVVLPEHCHLIMTLPVDDADYSRRLSLIKGTFSRQLKTHEPISLSRQKKRERGIWQRRFWEHMIRNLIDYENHVNYIHYNPVKHGYVSKPSDWQYSSIHRFINKGILTPNWGSGVEVEMGKYGE
ncbi:transposase [Legionella dresdenensis]|uniref:Transposase n=1 Tax=Legionella dresdenensis TaxID=450200 RepID=A0ABV8CEJ1_9GAMM